MKYSISNISLSHDDLVNFFSTALYGAPVFGVVCDENFQKQYENLKEKQGESLEDMMADILLGGGYVEIVDCESDGETYGNLPNRYDESEGGVVYRVTLQDIYNTISNIEDAFELAQELLIEEEGDMWTAWNLLQYVLFGEEIYG